ncbi:Crp/Fnr family transcriptional regulator [Runella slithyformis]|uniref:Transcriptional regulator, Crp/Fnr family n=1 Tax=Runella slithyformis (strain ATCC 29530 / DSM 19594 / LMG 11500 / NCIMB 11436 / LSU 4) TaxID=761193 RepID=A0A7U3ZGZ6_RUNSL|nr:Crp/Fnr family transcriptional regulator [Runella slithyformis]AEI46942.1 putative transcriptional regulator, Crp/Fnr family [Runella slithyformis DSM 19594]
MVNLTAALRFGGILNENSIQKVLENVTETRLKANEHFLAFGQIAHEIMFVSEGILRSYDVDNQGEEITKYFVRPNQFYADLESYYNLTPCENAIQAVTNAQVYVIKRKAWETLNETVPNFYLYTKSIIEATLLNKIKDNDFLNYGTAMDKYRELQKRYPEIVRTVPQQYIASYLKITPQSLSRIRKAMSKKE